MSIKFCIHFAFRNKAERGGMARFKAEITLGVSFSVQLEQVAETISSLVPGQSLKVQEAAVRWVITTGCRVGQVARPSLYPVYSVVMVEGDFEMSLSRPDLPNWLRDALDSLHLHLLQHYEAKDPLGLIVSRSVS